jgi:hypothetical protein
MNLTHFIKVAPRLFASGGVDGPRRQVTGSMGSFTGRVHGMLLWGIVCLSTTLTLGTAALADRPVEQKARATHVVVGKVERVFTRDTKSYREFIIELHISEVLKGRDLTLGHTLYVFCYQRKAGAGGLSADSSGHASVPREGEQVKVFVKNQRGQFEGVYPDWYEKLP